MSVSLPSKDIYVIDIPEVKSLRTDFVYGFFEKNERSSARRNLSRNNYVVDSSINPQRGDEATKTSKKLATQIPRQVNITFVPNMTINAERATRLLSNANNAPSLIKNNISKVMSEEQFTTFYYVALEFKDTAIYDKLNKQISGTMSQLTVADNTSFVSSDNFYDVFKAVMFDTSEHVDSKFLQDALLDTTKAGLSFDAAKKSKLSENDLTKVSVQAQINSKIIHQLVDRSIKDPTTLQDSDLLELHESSKTIQDKAVDCLKSHVIYANDFNTTAPPVKVDKLSSLYAGKSSVEIVGYIIEKTEVLRDGGVHAYPPIILENPNVNIISDLNVNYSSTYVYAVKTVALVTLPSIIEELNELASAKFLISSRPVVSTVECIDDIAPPPVADLNFVWNYEDDALMITWSFPPNPQRDIKKFQIYRRQTVDDAFELLMMYDFDDSDVKERPQEQVDEDLTDRMQEPKTFYYDREFTKQSRFIYAVTTVDAHGISSNYSIQFEVSFDEYNNKLVKNLVSHAGAPKTYPNLYMMADTFVDVMKDNGHSRVNVYFTPECYNLRVRGENGTVSVIKTTSVAAKYRLQMINLDLQKQQTIDITVSDMHVKAPIVNLGQLRKLFNFG
jgi:hypothetical protein